MALKPQERKMLGQLGPLIAMLNNNKSLMAADKQSREAAAFVDIREVVINALHGNKPDHKGWNNEEKQHFSKLEAERNAASVHFHETFVAAVNNDPALKHALAEVSRDNNVEPKKALALLESAYQAHQKRKAGETHSLASLPTTSPAQKPFTAR